jgi:hypothetical protein
MPGPLVSGADAAEPYRVLGVPPTASADDVRRAFRTLVRHHHPDVNPAARPGAELGSIVAAYRRLGRLGKLERPADVPETPRTEPAPRARGRYVDVYA